MRFSSLFRSFTLAFPFADYQPKKPRQREREKRLTRVRHSLFCVPLPPHTCTIRIYFFIFNKMIKALALVAILLCVPFAWAAAAADADEHSAMLSSSSPVAALGSVVSLAQTLDPNKYSVSLFIIFVFFCNFYIYFFYFFIFLHIPNKYSITFSYLF